jgi:hypothetical protein
MSDKQRVNPTCSSCIRYNGDESMGDCHALPPSILPALLMPGFDHHDVLTASVRPAVFGDDAVCGHYVPGGSR